RRVRGEAVGRAVRAHAGTGLGGIAGPRRRPAHRARVTGRVLARIAAAVALIERARIAVVGARGPTRLLGIRRTRGARARAGLRYVAHARGRAAYRAGGLEGVPRATRAGPVAGLGGIAGARRRAAYRAGVACRVLAGSAGAVAGVGRARIPVVGARCPVRLLHICRTGRTGPRAGPR